VRPGQRIAILAVAVVVLVGGFLLARGTGDDEPRPSEPTQTVAADTAPSAATAPRETQPAAPPAPRVETIRIRGRAPVGEPQRLRYESGETIRLRFRSDVAEEVHIHGYDEYVDVPAGGSATARFEGELEGVFEIESHGSGELLARLEVSP
jgi:hypothetical protein